MSSGASGGVELLSLAREGWAIVAGDGLVLAVFVVLVTATLGAFVLHSWMGRHRGLVATRGRPSVRHTPRAARVIALARRGAPPEAIARRTGLAQDAVSTILRTPTSIARHAAPRSRDAGQGRQPSPGAAASAVPSSVR